MRYLRTAFDGCSAQHKWKPKVWVTVLSCCDRDEENQEESAVLYASVVSLKFAT